MRDNLVNARKEKGLTQVEIANLIGTTERNYQYIEAGDSNGSIIIWQKISKILNKDIDYLLM